MIIQAMETSKLREYLDMLDRQMTRAAEYEAFAHSVSGKLLVADLESDREWTRSAYSGINPAGENANVALCGFQATEHYVNRLLERIVNHRKFAEFVADQRKSVLGELERRQQREQEPSTFVPGRRKSDDTGRIGRES